MSDSIFIRNFDTEVNKIKEIIKFPSNVANYLENLKIIHNSIENMINQYQYTGLKSIKNELLELGISMSQIYKTTIKTDLSNHVSKFSYTLPDFKEPNLEFEMFSVDIYDILYDYVDESADINSYEGKKIINATNYSCILEDIFKMENEFEESDIEKRINPKLYMNEGKTIISIAFPYLWNNDYVENGFSKYTKGYDYHKVVKMHLDKICNMIIEAGGKAISLVDSNALPERYIAYLAGVGFIGKNNMIITKTHGSYVFLGEIITDLNLYDDDVRKFDEISKFKECGECTICYKECPTKAINEYKKNPNICTSYITQKKELTDIEIKLLKDKIFGCDVCQNKCPYNENISFSKIKEFKPLEFMENGKYEVYAEINNKAFKEKILPTSCGWRGKNIIKRNAIIRLHNRGVNIEKYKGDSPYLNKYIEILNK